MSKCIYVARSLKVLTVMLKVQVLLSPAPMPVFKAWLMLESRTYADSIRMLALGRASWRQHWPHPVFDHILGGLGRCELVSKFRTFVSAYSGSNGRGWSSHRRSKNLRYLSLCRRRPSVAVTAFHVVVAIPGTREAVSWLRSLAIGIQTKERFYTMPMRAMSFPLVTQAARGGGESKPSTFGDLTLVRFSVRVDMLARSLSVRILFKLVAVFPQSLLVIALEFCGLVGTVFLVLIVAMVQTVSVRLCVVFLRVALLHEVVLLV